MGGHTVKRIIKGSGLFWLVIGFLIVIISLRNVELASMSDSKAMTTAQQFWGAAARIAKVRKFGDSNWTTQVGFDSPGCADDFTKVGTGFNTWDDAYSKIAPGTQVGGTYSGVATLQVNSPIPPPPPPVPVISEPVPGIVVTVQVVIDNQPGPVANTGQTDTQTPWSIMIPWDTTALPDGFHVMCAYLIHPDRSYSRSHATMLIVKQSAGASTFSFQTLAKLLRP
jgi:hypothetical protein